MELLKRCSSGNRSAIWICFVRICNEQSVLILEATGCETSNWNTTAANRQMPPKEESFYKNHFRRLLAGSFINI
jgi:hypothetical protein